METTSVVMSITDEQIAEIEAIANDACQYAGEDWFKAVDLSAWFADDDAQFMASSSPFVLLALISRLRAAELDAARYQFLRDSGKFSPSAFGGGWALNCGYTRAQPGLLDSAIDAAMKGERQ